MVMIYYIPMNKKTETNPFLTP